MTTYCVFQGAVNQEALTQHSFQLCLRGILASVSSSEELPPPLMQLVATMTADDSSAAASIEARTRKLAALGRAIASCKGCLAQSARDWEQRNSTLAAEKARLAAQQWALKTAAKGLSSRQTSRLKHLCLAW